MSAAFTDDFETGNFSRWTVISGTTPEVTAGNKYAGTYGAGFSSADVLKENYEVSITANVSIFGSGWKAQTFTTGVGYKCDRVKLFLFRVGSPTGDMTVAIRATDGDGKPTGADINVGTYPCSGITTNGDGAWYTFNLYPSAWFSASTKYAIVARVPSGDGGNCIAWKINNIDPPPAGMQAGMSLDSGSTWTMSDGAFWFEAWQTTYGEANRTISESTAEATLTTRFRLNALNGGIGPLLMRIQFYSGSDYVNFYLGMSGSRHFGVGIYVGSTWYGAPASSVQATLGSWYKVAIVCTAGTGVNPVIKLYVDDVLLTTYSPSVTITATRVTTIGIGTITHRGGFPYSVSFDDVILTAPAHGGPIKLMKDLVMYQLAEQALTPSGPRVRYRAGGTTYEVPLVATSDPYASPARVHTSTGTWALRWANIWGKFKQGTLDILTTMSELPEGWSRWWLSTLVADTIVVVSNYWWSSVIPLTAGVLMDPGVWWSAIVAEWSYGFTMNQYWWSSITATAASIYSQYWWSSISADSTKGVTGYWWSSVTAI